MWPLRWSIQVLKMSGVGIYAKNWTKDMGVRTGPRPQERIQKPFFPAVGKDLPWKISPKSTFDPQDNRFRPWKQNYSKSTRKTGLTTWGSEQACSHSKGSKNGIFPPWGGGSDSAATKCTNKKKKMGEMLANDILIKRSLFLGLCPNFFLSGL